MIYLIVFLALWFISACRIVYNAGRDGDDELDVFLSVLMFPIMGVLSPFIWLYKRGEKARDK